MRNRDRFLPIFLLSLALAAPAVIPGAAPAEAFVKDKAQKEKEKPKQNRQNDDWREDHDENWDDEDGTLRFEGMDTNRDVRITRSEWRGNDRSFENHDWNGDGILSGEEVRPGGRRETDREDDWTDRFERLDRNNDGYLSESEWPRDQRLFDRLDQNNDGRLSRSELLNRNGGIYPRDERRFRDLDRNGDSRLSPTEWTGSRDFFDRLDRNDDGVLSLNEWLGR